MKKNFKKSLAVLMSVLMLLSVVSVSAFAAEVKLEYLPGRYSTDTAPAAIMVEKNSTVTLLGAIFTREGYEQTGWSTSSSGSRKNYELGDSFKITKNTKLYPYWEAAKIKVTFAPGANGVGAAVVEEVASGKTTKFPGAIFTREDHVLVGWSSVDGGEVEYAINATTPTITEPVTYYPVWEKCDYSVKASISNADFGSSCVEYTSTKSQELVIKNIGNMTLTYTLPSSSNFDISVKSGSLTLGAGESVTIEIANILGLGSGTYEDTLVFDCDYDGSDVTVAASFKVKEHAFTKYESNNNASYIANGTKTAFCSNGCGASDTIEDEGSMKIYSADNNDAVGLAKEYIYHRTVRFTAFGSGMDAEGEINTRFVPTSWYVSEEFNGEFTGNQFEDGYNVTFTHTIFGNYTLTINYVEEEYNEETGEWVATGVTDEKTFDYVVGTNAHEEQEIVRPNTILSIIFGLFAKLLSLLGLGG